MRYFVVSPNAANDGRVEEYLAYMRKQHVVLMGWDTSHKSGQLFSEIQPGDCVLVAKRRNWKWESYFVGIANTTATNDQECGYGFTQRIELRQFTDFGNVTDLLPFEEGCTSFSKQIPGAIFELQEDNEHDAKIIRILKSLTDQKKIEQNCIGRAVQAVFRALSKGFSGFKKQ